MRTTLQLWNKPSLFVNSEIDRWFDELVSSPAWAATERESTFRPACDFEETDSHYLFSLDVPGMKKEDFSIEVTGDSLTIHGERKSEGRRADKGQTFSERVYGKFYRQFQFPVGVNADDVQAEYENGVLRVALAKTADAKPRKVEIKGEAHKPGLFEKFIGKKEAPVVQG